MCRTLICSIAALALASASSAAVAADMAPVPAPAPVTSWTGFYLGAGGGLQWADLNLDNKFCNDFRFHRML